MESNTLWQKLKDLSIIDQKSILNQQSMAACEQALYACEQKIFSIESSIREKKITLQKIRHDIALKELDLKTFLSQEQRKRNQIDLVIEQKSYKAIEKEIAVLTQKRLAQEQLLQDAQKQIELLVVELDQLEEKRKASLIDKEEFISKKQKNYCVFQDEQKILMVTREKLLKSIPAATQHQYERMKNTVENPVVPTVNNSCSVCFYSVVHHDLSKLFRQELVVCKNCYRFLFNNNEQV